MKFIGAHIFDYDATFRSNVNVTGNLDVDGTINIDAADIDGNLQLDGTLTVGEDDTGYDVKFYGATSGRYLLWDESDNNLEFVDNVKAVFGSSGGLEVFKDGTNSYLRGWGGDIIIENNADDKDIIFKSDDGSGGTTDYFRLDGGTGYVKFEDNRRIAVGSGNDFMIYHDGTDTKFSNVTGTLQFHQNVNDSDIIFFCDDGSGGVTAYITLDGSATNIKVAKDMRFYDNVEAEFGTNGDFKIYHDGSNTYLEQINAGAGNIVISNANDDADVILQSDDGSGGVTPYLTLDGGLGFTQAQKKIRFIDNIPAEFGSQGDFTINHNGSHLTMNNSVGNITIRNYTDDGDIIFQSDDGSGGTETYFYLDGSIGLTTFPDNKKLAFGSGNDLQIKHNGTDGFITNVLGNLNISTSSDNSDIIFSSDDGSGGTTAYLTLDGGLSVTKFSKNTVHSNGVNAYFGSSSVASISHNGSDFTINNTTGNFTIKNSADNSDIIFQSDDGSGGTTTYLTLDGSDPSLVVSKKLLLGDNVSFYVGSNVDLELNHDGSDSFITARNTDLKIQQLGDDKDIVFICDDGSGGVTEYFRLDGSVGYTQAYKKIRYRDSVKAEFGDAGDLDIYHDGSNSYISQGGTGDLYITQNVDDKDIIFQSDDGSGGLATYFYLDGSAGGTNPITIFPDNSYLKFGSSSDLSLHHNGSSSISYIENSTGDLNIINYANDKDIIFQSDDGSGGNTAYLTLDGSESYVKFNKDAVFVDDEKAKFGTGLDLEIYHDGSNSYINQRNTGDLIIQASSDDKDIIFKSDDGSGGTETYFFLDGSTGQTRFPDGKILALGTGGDLRIQHDSNNSYISQEGTGDLFIRNTTDDKDVLLQTDNGSGGVTSYIQLDGSDLSTKILTQKLIISNLPTSDPGVSGQVWNNNGVLNISAGG